MKKIISIIAAALSLTFAAVAQDNPKMETFLGYNFVRFRPDSGFVPSFNANGGSGQFVYNFHKWVGAAVDIGAVNKGILNGHDVDTTVMHFVAGPRFSYHNHTRFTPYGEALFGGAYGTTSALISGLPLVGNNLNLDPNLPVSARLTASRTVFAMMIGGGLDIKLSKHVAFRPAGFDYYLTRVPSVVSNDDINRNNWRYSAGVNFMFGAR
jgi:opacity protein-like surface antigen